MIKTVLLHPDRKDKSIKIADVTKTILQVEACEVHEVRPAVEVAVHQIMVLPLILDPKSMTKRLVIALYAILSIALQNN